MCGWDGGDCIGLSHQFNEKYPRCHLSDSEKIVSNQYNGKDDNNKECGWDGGDCVGKLILS